MRRMTDSALAGRLLNALRSVAVADRGLRIGALPKPMAQLVEMSLVEERAVGAKGRGWFLTQAGREEIRWLGVDEVGSQTRADAKAFGFGL